MPLGTILVVEDEPSVLRAIRATLEADYKVLEAESASRAMEISNFFPAKIHLVIADHALKDGTGPEVVRLLKDTRPGMRILYFSGHDRQYLAESGVTPDAEILHKPFKPKELLAVVENLLRPEAKECEETLCDEVLGDPSVFGRLVAVTSRFDAGKRLYRHPLAVRCGAETTDLILRRLHRAVFTVWLRLSLRQQDEDLRGYLSSVADRAGTVEQMLETGPNLIPDGVTKPERISFLHDLAILQALLSHDG